MVVRPEVRFLTQEEVAQLLRRSVASVARLRRAGELAWLPGSPILIPETELNDYLERKMVKRRTREQPPARTGPTPEEKGAALVAKLKRRGHWDGIVALQRQVRENAKK